MTRAITPSDFDLIIFDCDGVLIDSEVINNRVDAEELTRIGYPVTSETLIRRFTGMPYDAMFAAIETEMGKPLPDGFIDHVNARIEALLPAELRAIDGIHQFVSGLSHRKCVASSTYMPKLRKCLGLVNLIEHFDPHIFSASQVMHGKPAPDLFLLAAETLDCSPDRCLVIEDSHAGVTAGIAAGMTVIGFTGGGHTYDGHGDRLTDAGAMIVTKTAAQLSNLLIP